MLIVINTIAPATIDVIINASLRFFIVSFEKVPGFALFAFFAEMKQYKQIPKIIIATSGVPKNIE